MNIDKLEVGKKFKNYKALCNELGMEIKNGSKSKKYQLRELERYCVYHNDGHSFIIDEVFEAPLPKVDGRKDGNNSIYTNYIQVLILDLLAQNKIGHIVISRSNLQRSIAITNINYGYCSYNVPKLAKYIDSSESVIYDFFNTSNSNFRNAIDTALKILEDKRIIICDKVTKVCDEHKITRLATDTEKRFILLTEKSILEDMGFEKMSQIRMSSLWKEFKRRVGVILGEELNIEFYYSAYDITINEQYVEKELNNLIDLLLEDSIRNEYKTELNSTVCENILKNAQARHENWFHSKKMGKYRKSDNYMDTFKQLNNLVIDKNAPNLIEEVMNVKLDEMMLDDFLFDDLFA